MDHSHPRADILAIDAGTSGLKAVLYTLAGRVVASAAHAYGYQTPQPGWAEADPELWWSALVNALADLRSRGFDLTQLQVIGITGQMHSLVLLGEDNRPVRPAILWLDRRAVAETAELRRTLGLPPSRLNSSFTLPKLLWLARHQPEALAQTHMVLWPKDYLRFRLTGRFHTDVTEAGGAALYDETKRGWATDRLSLVGLPISALPPICAPTAEAGPLPPQIAAQLGLSPQVKIIVGAGDVLALLGGAPPKVGRLTCSLGSSAMISCRLAADQTISDPAERLYIYPFLPTRLLNGLLSTSGASLTWAINALYSAGESSFETVLAQAVAVAPGADGLIFLPYLAGERSPYWNDALRGGFYGLTLAHSRAHMVRAVLEGVAFSLRHLIEIAGELNVPINEIALAGGGATTPGWPQIFADVCRRPVLLYAAQETVTRPLYAFCATVLNPDLPFEAALHNTFGAPQQLNPDPAQVAMYDQSYRIYEQLAEFVSTL